jgi:phosphoheptose isomerase
LEPDNRTNGSTSSDAARTAAHMVATDYFASPAGAPSLVPGEVLAQAIDVLLGAGAADRGLYVIGDGSSAGTASHPVCDLAEIVQVPAHQPLRALALSDNAVLLTAWTNDTAYGRIFFGQLAALVEPGDVVIATGSNGKSPNIAAGLTAAAAAGAHRMPALLRWRPGTRPLRHREPRTVPPLRTGRIGPLGHRSPADGSHPTGAWIGDSGRHLMPAPGSAKPQFRVQEPVLSEAKVYDPG